MLARLAISSLFLLSLTLTVSCSDDEVEDTATGGAGGTGGSSAAGGGGGSSGSGGATGGAAGTGGGAGTGGSAGMDGSAGSDAADAASDASDAASDAPSDVLILDGGAKYPDVLFQGVWFAGWAGGMDHFSWMKLSETSPGSGNGTWAALDSKCTSCTPYFKCQGKDGLFIASKSGAMTLTLQYPLACAGDSGAPGSEEWTFLSFSAPGSFPGGALMEASVQVGSTPSNVISAYLYPSSQCTSAFDACTNPF